MLCPLQQGYSFTPGNNLLEQKTARGMPHKITDFVGAVHSVTVSVSLDDKKRRQYFWAFWRRNQTTEWNWRLSLDSGVIEDCVCSFTSESLPAESLRNGVVIKVSFMVFVRPIQRDADDDRDLVELWQGGATGQKEDISKIPNEYLPDALGRKNYE